MYKRLLFFMPVVAFLLLAFIPGVVSAKAIEPHNIDCSNGCENWLTWPGTTYGYFGSFTVSNPNVSSVSFWARWVDMTPDTDHNSSPQVQFGVVKTGSSATQVCGPGLHYFITEYTTATNDENTKCAGVPSGAINNTSHFQENDYTSTGGGNLIQITDSFGTNLSDFIPYTAGVHSSWGSINLNEAVQDSIAGHYVWGSAWYGNEWQTGDGVFHLVTVDGTFDYPTNNVNPPPQMFWHTPPSQAPGGTLYSCVYNSLANSCTPGS